MVFYGVGMMCVGTFFYMWRNQRTRTEKNSALLLALFAFGAGINQRNRYPFEAAIVQFLEKTEIFLLLIAPYVLGLSSIGLIVHAFNRLRKRPESRKYRVVAASGILMLGILVLVLINRLWLNSSLIFSLETMLDYVFLYLLITFIIFLFMVLSSRVISPSFNKSWVIILGTGLAPDGGVSLMLKYRLDRAIQYQNNQIMQGYEPATLVVSGGKSPDDAVSEAEVMQAYLLEKGVTADKIIVEDQSINTHQNFLYSQRLLKSQEKILFVTSSYHVLRGGVYASQLGIEAEGIGAKTPIFYLPYALLREYLALFLIYRHIHFLTLSIYLISAYLYNK
ncbi:YdcF family protein [Jeotgalibaca sp. A122]|uniref:YdcF family protein n=1 Tax=Jeotgalibaca sp. A122 TaxID=3457322 RepID=UPI003FD3BEA2